MKVYLTLILLTIAIPASAAEDPVGDWTWIGTRDTWNGEFRTPEEYGFTLRYVYDGAGNFVKYRDGAVLYSGTYTFWDQRVQFGEDEWIDQMVAMLDFDPAFEIFSYRIGEGPELTTWSGMGDGGWWTYPRSEFVPTSTVDSEPVSWSALKASYR